MRSLKRILDLTGSINLAIALGGCLLLFCFSLVQELSFTKRDVIESAFLQGEKIERAISDSDVVSLKMILKSLESSLAKRIILRDTGLAKPLDFVVSGYHNDSKISFSKSTKLHHNGRNLGELTLVVYLSDLVAEVLRRQWLVLGLFFLFTLGALFLSNFRINSVLGIFEDAILMFKQKTLQGEQSDLLPILESQVAVIENKLKSKAISSVLTDFLRTLIDSVHAKESVLKALALNEVSKQVAHDIRSPLMALNIALGEFKDLSSDRRRLVEQAICRIRGIADDLLSRSGTTKVPSDISHQFGRGLGEIQKFEITSSVKRIVAEMKLVNPLIEFELCGHEVPIDVPGNSQDFERILANLLQNAVESMTGLHDPRVSVAVRAFPAKVQLAVLDNGKGIPSDILAKIGEEGFTFGKKAGNGLGVFSAKRKMIEWRGDLSISSNLGLGTMVNLSFPKVAEQKFQGKSL